MVSDAGAGLDTCVGQLDRGIQSFCGAGSKSIDHDHDIRFGLFYDSPDDLGGFHSILCHNAGRKCADLMHFFFIISGFAIFPDNMSGDAEMVNNRRSKRIGGHIAVTETDHEDRLLLLQTRNQLFELSGKLCGNFTVTAFIVLHHVGCFYGNISAHRLTNRLGAVSGSHIYFCDVRMAFFSVIFRYRYPVKRFAAIRIPDTFMRLQREVGSDF